MPETYNITTKTNVKTHLGITGTGDDTLLDTLCDQVTAWIENYCGGRRFYRTLHENEVYDGEPKKDYLVLKHFPVIEITSIQYNAGTSKNPNWTNMDRDDYELYENEGVIYWNKIYDGVRNIRVSYNAGYSTMPYDLVLVANRLVARVYDKRKSEHLSNESLEGVNVNWGEFLRPEDKLILDSYSRRNLV